VVVCYGGDGTLLSAERRWPGVPKVPIRNSRRGHRCIAHPPDAVIERLVEDRLVRMEFVKLECALRFNGTDKAPCVLAAMNEFNVHMGHINAAVRFKLWLDDEAYAEGREILGDGLVVSTPFGSTAYFTQITRGVFHAGLGLAFKNTTELTSHVIVPDHVAIRVLITRGPAMLAFDNSSEYIDLGEGDRLELRKHPRSAIILTWEQLSHPTDAF
jgi:NAD+ kinase